MGVFFDSLNAMEKVFFICAIVGGLVFLIRLILSLLGAHHGDIDIGGHDVDFGGHDSGFTDHHGDSDSSFKAVSIQGISVFFMMFGLVGLAMSRQSGYTAFFSMLGAIIAGILSFWLIGKLFKFMKQFQSEGNLDIRNAIGKEGTVYLNIPEQGDGVVQIEVQGTLRELSAVSADKISIKTGERVIVENITGNNFLVVRKI